MDRVTLFFAALAAVTGAALWQRDGVGAVLAALGEGAGLLAAVLPLVAMAVLMAGYVQLLLPQRVVQRWLGQESGLRGLLLATAAGAVTPGGPFTAFPLVVGLRGVGASVPVCITYLTSWSVLGIQRVLVWELTFFGTEFVLLRLLVSLPLPLLAGLASLALTRRAAA